MEKNIIPKRLLYMNLETTGSRVDQEIDGRMKRERREEWLVEKSGRKNYITERNGKSS
jgi:hypothetical protein